MSAASFRPAAEAEKNLGLEYFYTDIDGIGGRLRTTPQDFVVEEISEKLKPAEDGRFTAAVIRATNWETNRLVRIISKKLGISRNNITFAGTKDKRAVTTQLLVFLAPLEDVRSLEISDVEILDAFATNRSVRIGDLYGNRFCITVRELEPNISAAMDNTEKIWGQLSNLGGFPNYFGVQRFGVVRPITHKIGEHMVRGEPDKAVRAYLCDQGMLEGEESCAARAALAKTWDVHQALADFPHTLSFERIMLNHLAKKPDDFMGALGQLPKNLLIMFVHAQQSLVFNRILSRRMREGLPLNEPVEGDLVLKMDKYGLPDHDDWLKVETGNIQMMTELCRKGKAFVSAPLFGYASEFATGEPGEIEASVVEETGLENKNYILPDFDKMDLKGTRREILAPAKDFKFGAEEDAIRFEFALNKGCYATTLMREFMKKHKLEGY